MKRIALFACLLFTGCSHQQVVVSINSLKGSEALSKEKPVVFSKKTEEIEIEKLRRECIKGAVAAGTNVVPECSSNCYWASIEGQSGESKERTYSYFNYYTKQTETHSSNVTDRKIKLVLYSDSEMKNIAYQSVLDSSGGAKNVLSVAEEMCEAAFKAFPEEYSNEVVEIKSR